ncbi:MAG: UDP-N-acetylglucosamine 2-epimerase (non-hydrolyzing) [Rhodoferax sp.]|uniref:non-hydrolyzing UDP-N-acetylglucosamine 2-epimerase n=1 Tax=Rhodoferax sp. TaxID=50421 RepID=UPI00261EEFD9|nr:UDP-N-acetylglucosamine 2-epimerase (non-hydrolyzing) [Rhodoferax sp.]MDD5334872.1 UDP-N-acetylglucosamine 2-epimerase (non-hydrolyzing) [Rhodoferax sp.]
MKILTVIGARPQFIKAAVVSRAFAIHRSEVREILVHTGQHYDTNMSDVFFEELSISHPDYNLGIGGGSHAQNTGRMLEKLEALMVTEKPALVLVYGDTDSTLAGALAAAKLHIPVAHVEAGLRSYNRRMPEEINRILTDHVSTFLFVPSKAALRNLLNEGIPKEKIHVVGDVMCDAARYFEECARKPDWFDALDIEIGEFVLCTIHRAENTNDSQNIKDIFEGLVGSCMPVILPLHPRTRIVLQAMGIPLPTGIRVVDPVGYLEMTWLEMNCRIIATDSGGIQKEAYFHNKMCVTLREETEWTELVDNGFNIVAGTNSYKITEALTQKNLMVNSETSLYGQADAATKIAALIVENYM